MTESAPQTDPWLGRTIADQFHILERLGAGGMGSVYLAEQIGMGRQVVIKVILAKLIHDPEAVERFRREARTIARLRHPNIVQVYTSGETDDGGLYLAMEYVTGRTLGQVLKRTGTMTDNRIVHVAKQVAAALAAAHAAGVVHRDLKPANIMLTEHPGNPDHVIVLDFGIAKVLEERQNQTKLTQTGWMMGTPAYMAPEQIEARPVDGRTDIYTLGVMLYEMATGANPFDAETPIECMLKHLKEPVTPTRERFPDLGISPALEACIQTCLEKSPDSRFQSAEALLDRLRAIETRTAPMFLTPQPQPRSAPRARRSLIVIAIVFALIATGVLYASLTRDGQPSDVAEQATVALVNEEESPGTSADVPSEAADDAGAPTPTGAIDDAGSPAPSEPGDVSTTDTADEPKPPRIQQGGVVNRTPPPISPYRPAIRPPVAGYPTQRPPTVAPSPAPRVAPSPVPRVAPTPVPPAAPPTPAPVVPAPVVVEQPPPEPPAEPVLESDGPFGAPIVSGTRMETNMGSLARYRSTFPFEEVAALYEEELRDEDVMMARHGEGLEAYLGIIDSGGSLTFNMIRIQPEADGLTTLIFFGD